MKINYIGHSCFLFRERSGASLLTDPYGDVGLSFPRVKADIVTVSHSHYDHCNVGAVGGDPTVFREAGKFTCRGVAIDGIECFHDDANGAKRGNNLIFSFVMDGVRVSHMGDLGQKYNEEILRKVGHTDVLLLPVGGNYTIDGEEAAWYVKKLSPAVVIPMHYHVKGLTVDIEDEKRFLQAMGGGYSTAREVEFTVDTLPAAQKIIMMERMEYDR